MKIRKNVHLFPSTRRKTRHLSRRRKFEIFSETRLPKLLKVMKSVGNLSNQRYYEYKDWEKIKIMKDFRDEIDDMLDNIEEEQKLLANESGPGKDDTIH